MRSEFKALRLNQLDRDLNQFRKVRDIARPSKGWLRAIREALGIPLRELGARMGTSHQLLMQQEKAEARGTITLKSLKSIADSLGFDLVYALVPRAGSMMKMIEEDAHVEAQKRVLDVEHSMALENQSVGRLDEAIEAEVQRRLVERTGR